MITFELPQLQHQKMFEAYKDEFYNHNEMIIHGDGGCSHYDCYKEWLEYDQRLREGKDIPRHLVKATTYFVIEDNKLVGTLNIRHTLNQQLLQRGGHIGYSVLVSQRRKGIATKMLTFGIDQCHRMGIRDILVTCQQDNVASRKTIEKCGGHLENVINIHGEKILRYWIKGEEK